MNVLTIGTFDIPHMGHAVFLQRAARYGELTVGVNSDQFVETYKGAAPLFSFGERAALIHQLGFKVAGNDGAGFALIKMVNPDVLVIGSDWLDRDYLTQVGMTGDELAKAGIDLVFVPYTAEISTTTIKARCG